MLMYKKFLSKKEVMEISDEFNAADVQQPSLKKEFSNLKLKKVHCRNSQEKFSCPLKALLLFPENCYQIKNIETICDSLNIIYNTAWSSSETLKAVKSIRYNIMIVDRRHYPHKPDVNEIVINLKKMKQFSYLKIVSFSDNVSDEYSDLYAKGYDEQWINYNDFHALKNYLASFIKNQFVNTFDQMKISVLQNVFDMLMDSIEILDNDFNIELCNLAFQKLFSKNTADVLGENWFSLHEIPPDNKKLILDELETRNRWDGTIMSHYEDVTDNTFSYYATIRTLDVDKNQYIVYMGGNFISNSRSEHSFSLSSNERDSAVVTYSKNRESFIMHNQIGIETPVLRIIKIINSIQDVTTPSVHSQLQKIIDILSSKDLSISTVDALKTDKMSSNLIDGLLSNNATIFAQTETRRHSSSLARTKISKIPELPETEEMDAIDELLDNYQSWSFDILKLESLSESKPLRYLGMRIFTRFDLGVTLNIDSKLFQNWLSIIESNYNESNAYHNSTHAADVLQSSAWFLERSKINEIFDSYDDAISIIAAIIHDLGHPGRTNPFLINSNHNLAVFYNDIAVLENHHVSFAFKLTLKDDRINIFKNLNRDDYRSVRHGVIDAVLATEMAKHFEHLNKFLNGILNVNDFHTHKSSFTSESTLQDIAVLSQPENKSIIRRMLIKCSDVNNPTRHFSLCQEWANRISEEYFNQTDEEISREIPVVMPQFNRKTCDIPQSQITFIDLFLTDMFGVWNSFADTEELVTNLFENKVKWKALSEKSRLNMKTTMTTSGE